MDRIAFGPLPARAGLQDIELHLFHSNISVPFEYCYCPQAAGGLEMSAARLKHFGWGREGEGLTAEEEAFVMARAAARFGTPLKESANPPPPENIKPAHP